MKFIIIVFLLSCLNTAFAQGIANKESFTLRGHIVTNKNGLVWFRYTNKEGKDILDSAYLDHGNFLFIGSVNGATRATLRFSNKSLGVNDPNSISMFIENANMTFDAKENDLKNAKITGSNTQVDHEKLERSKKELLMKKEGLSVALKELNKAIKNSDTISGTAKKQELINLELQKATKQLKQLDFDFIEENPNAHLSSYLLLSYITRYNISVDSAELFFNKFTERIYTGTFGKLTREHIQNVKSSRVGSLAPLFSLDASDGRKVKLEDFREKKFVLIDFWASWCVPCREILPKITQLHQKYEPMGLDIVSISIDTDKKAWLKAVDQNKKSWHQVIDPIPFEDGGSMMRYAIPSIPLLLLIDKKGIIIGRYENGDLTNLDKKLNEIFKTFH